MGMNGTSGASQLEENLYELLQVSPRANSEVIRAAYHVLARSYHPDINPAPSAAYQMRVINQAYAVLSDPVQRAQYDARGGAEAARSSRHRRSERRSRAAGQRPAEEPSRPEGRSRRGWSTGRIQPELGRAPWSPLWRTVLAGLLITVVVALVVGLWAVLDRADDGFTRPSRSSDSPPRFAAPLRGGEGSYAPGTR